MKPKVLITGPSGMGKTTLAKYLAERFNVPFINVGMVSNICKCHGLKTHKEVIEYSKENPNMGGQLQIELMASRSTMFFKHQASGFVTDRGPIDSLVYSELQVAQYMPEGNHRFMEFMIKQATSDIRAFTHVILIPWIDGWEIENDGVRVVDPEFQKQCSEIYLHYISKFSQSGITALKAATNIFITKSYYPHFMVLKEYNFKERQKACQTFFQITNVENNFSYIQ